MAREDPTKWENVINVILGGWKSVHDLKSKHLLPDSMAIDERTQSILDEINDISNVVMAAPLERRLRSTGPSLNDA
jgi:hypothetical protein